jgi:hypothetical protein
MAVNKLAAALAMTLLCGLSTQVTAQSPHVLNNFEDGSTESWRTGSGTISNITTHFNENTETTELTFTINGAGSITDSYNNTGAVFQPSAGGVDLTGLSAIEMDIRYEGDLPTHNLQFFVQATNAYTFVGMSDVTLTAGEPAKTITFNLASLTPPQVAHIKGWGVSIRAFPGGYAGGPLQYYIDEVRSVGTPLTSRVYCDFTPTASDGGFHGIFMNFNGNAIVGNSGQNHTGFERIDYPDTDGVLYYQQQYAEGANGPYGPAWSWQNGFLPGFDGRPTDISNYNFIEVDMMLENESGTPLDVAYFTQSAVPDEFGFISDSAYYTYHTHDSQTLQANAGFQTLVFALDHDALETFNSSHLMRNGIITSATAQGEINHVYVDEIRAVAESTPPQPASGDGFAIY